MKKTSIFLILFLFSTIQVFSGVVVLNGLTHVHLGEAGSQLSGKIKIRNDSPKENRIILYKQDLMLSCDNNSIFEYKDINTNPKSMGSWLKVNVDEKILGPHEEYDLSYSIYVPKNVTQKGSYWTVLMIEGADPIHEPESQSLQVGSKIRYAVQLITEIGSFESPKLQFENVEYKKGVNMTSNVVQVKIRNVGEYSAQTKVLLEIYDSKGSKLKVFQGSVRRIYPNLCNVFELEIKDLPKGIYDGVIIADNSKDLFGSNISIKIE
jgi:hypothetical protein